MKFIKEDTLSKYKIKRRYRLSFQSENTLNELWSVKLTRGKVAIGLAIIIAALTTLISTIIVSTPLRTFLPGYLKSEQRSEVILNSFRVDSLETALALNDAYIANIKNILNDDIPLTAHRDSTGTIYTTDSLIEQSAREKKFITEYDEHERFNLSILTPIVAEGLVFASPAQGIVAEDENATTIHIATPRNATVYSIYNGTVISVTRSTDGNSIMIQHPSGFISVYSSVGNTFVERGAKVAAAQAIAAVNGNTPVCFELWHDGTPAAPCKFINF